MSKPSKDSVLMGRIKPNKKFAEQIQIIKMIADELYDKYQGKYQTIDTTKLEKKDVIKMKYMLSLRDFVWDEFRYWAITKGEKESELIFNSDLLSFDEKKKMVLIYKDSHAAMDNMEATLRKVFPKGDSII